MEKATYEGCSNYETWCVNLWFSNDEGLYDMLRERAIEALRETDKDDEKKSRVDDAAREVADFIGSTLEELAPPLETGLFSDLLTHAVGMADLREIAYSWVEEEVDEILKEEKEKGEEDNA